MYPLGHIGISAGVVHAIDRRADLRLVPLYAIFPDLVDKSLAIVAPAFTNGWSRSVAHSITGWALFSLACVLVQRRKAWVASVACGLHHVLDRMWEEDDHHILLWPFRGFSFDPRPPHPEETLWTALHDPWVLQGEMTGLAVLVFLAWRGRIWERAARRAFLATGVPGAPPIAAS